MMAAPADDHSDLYNSEQYSDAVVVLEEEAAGISAGVHTAGCDDECAVPSAKRLKLGIDDTSAPSPAVEGSGSKAVLPGHAVVLRASSSFCKTKLDNWQSCGREGKLEIRIQVPPGQLSAGKLLVRCMYEAQPDVSPCSLEHLLQLLQLAHCYDVPKATAAVAAACANVTPNDLPWPTLLAVLRLLPDVADKQTARILLAAAMEKLQELGDLELAWAEEQKQQLLLSMPQFGLWLLLRDHRTRVASENTVMVIIDRWCLALRQQQPLNSTAMIAKEARGLLRAVRMKNCTPLFVASVVPNTGLIASFKPGELAAAAAIATAASAGDQPLLQILCAGSSVREKFPTWVADKRPASAMQPPEIVWQLPLEQLAQQHLVVAANSHATVYSPNKRMWFGTTFQPVLAMFTADMSSDAQGSLNLGLTLGAELLPGAACHFSFVASFITTPNSRLHEGERQQLQQQQPQVNSLTANHVVMYRRGLPQQDSDTAAAVAAVTVFSKSGHRTSVHLGQMSSRPAVEAKLRELQLVHSDGCLHLLVQVLQVM